MKLPFSGMFQGMRELSGFNALDAKTRSIVFYAEDAGSWVHFEGIIAELTGRMGRQVCYLTSDANDPVLQAPSGITPFYIGTGSARTAMFKVLQARVMVMTMPDLETFHIKRSRFPVHYIYVHHSIVSTHMVYRPAAFDHFDTVFCVGPHHQAEIRAREDLYGLRRKTLVDHGYQRLDSLMNTSPAPSRIGGEKRVLIAPSWGQEGLLETCGGQLVDILLATGYLVTLRPHPMTIMKSSRVISELHRRFDPDPKVTFDIDMASEETLQDSDIMISDWSGAALEYAFGLERPVIFIDVPRKINNPDYEDIPNVPIEVMIRAELGAVVSPQSFTEVPSHIESLCAHPGSFNERVQRLRADYVYNIGSSGAVGAEHIANLVDGSGNELSQADRNGTSHGVPREHALRSSSAR